MIRHRSATWRPLARHGIHLASCTCALAAMAACAADAPGGTAGAAADLAVSADAHATPDQTATDGSAHAAADGSADALAPDAIAPTGCAGAALLCEDFEGPLSSTWQQTTKGGASLSIDNARAVDGTSSLRVRAPVGKIAAWALIRTETPFPIPGNRFYGRVHLYASSPHPSGHVYYLAARGQLAANDPAEYRLDAWQGQIDARYTSKAAYKAKHGGLRKYGPTLPLDRWLCLEWEIDGANSAMRWWIDGAPLPKMTVSGNESPVWQAPTWSSFELGVRMFANSKPAKDFQLWYDALVLHDKRVGCGPAAQP